VLRKLRRDYGVKVVATRERPGANLVINCDEYTSQDNSICNKHASEPTTGYQMSRRPQADGGERMASASRRRPARRPTMQQAYGRVEHEMQPTSEPGHVYMAEAIAAENHQEDSARGAAEHAAPAHMDEQSGGHEAAAAAYENGDSERTASMVGQSEPQAAGHGQEEGTYEAAAHVEHGGVEQRGGASAQPEGEHESYQLASADEQQDGGHGSSAMRRDEASAIWPAAEDETKQVEPAESAVASKRTVATN
jgi:hypothetical protein